MATYGDDPDQLIELFVPTGPAHDVAVMLLHGGYWYDDYGRGLMTSLARDLARRGHVAANVEYARIGSGGGWPRTFTDVAAALDTLPQVLATHTELDPDASIAVVGQSAGGHLALWLAGRGSIPDGQPGAHPAVVPVCAVSMSGVTDLRSVASDPVGRRAVRDLLGGSPDEVPERYDVASPIELLPTGVPTLVVHGRHDELVPPAMSTSYVDSATAVGDPAELSLTNDDHVSVLEPSSEAWQTTAEWLGRCGEPTG